MFGSFGHFSYLYYVIKDKNMNKLVFSINETNCIKFLKKYPNVAYLMTQSKGKNLLSAYKKFIKLKDVNESKLGAKAEIVSSPTFGTKTFYKFDFCGCGGWAEVFEFVYNKTK
jgi:hypothetical protein